MRLEQHPAGNEKASASWRGGFFCLMKFRVLQCVYQLLLGHCSHDFGFKFLAEFGVVAQQGLGGIASLSQL